MRVLLTVDREALRLTQVVQMKNDAMNQQNKTHFFIQQGNTIWRVWVPWTDLMISCARHTIYRHRQKSRENYNWLPIQ